MPLFVCRKATLTDVENIEELFQTTVLTVNRQDYSQDEVNDWVSCGQNTAKWEYMVLSHYFIVIENEALQLLGFASLTPQGYLHNMFVHKDFQRADIGTLLLKEIERYAMKARMKRLTADVSLTARYFFETYGWHVEQSQVQKAHSLFLSNFRMSKLL